MTTAAAPVNPLQLLPLAQLHESKHNPRKFYDPVALQELADSLRSSTGQLTPILARPIANGKTPAYEIAAGHRRFRAAAIAGLATVQVIVRDMDDAAFIEALNVENLQRKDIHPLEEARGFQDLITIARLDVARIAKKVGKSEKYVYDRIKLLQLTPQAQKLFLAGRFEAGHAILLARLTKEDQARAFGLDDEDELRYGNEPSGGVFAREDNHGLFTDDDEEAAEKKDPLFGLKARSVRELEAWINRNVRLDVKRDADPMIFPELIDKVAPALETKRKVVPITHEYRVPDAARTEERTYGSEAWVRADGAEKSKTCEHSVMGAIVAGPGRGQAFQVCVNKHKCDVHWPAEAKAFRAKEKARKEQVAKGAVSPKTASAAGKADAAVKAREAKEEAERKAQAAEQARIAKAMPELLKRLGAHLKKAPAGWNSPIGKFLHAIVTDHELYLNRDGIKAADKAITGQSGDDVVRWLVFAYVADDLENGYGDFGEHVTDCKALGFDLKKALEEVAPLPAPEKPKAEKKPAAKTAAKKRTAKKAKR